MQNKYIILGLVGLLAIGGFLMMRGSGGDANLTYEPTQDTNTYPLPTPVIPSAGVSVQPITPGAATTGVKEFTMTSWMETVDGKMTAHFSLAEMVVKKGDTVRVKVKNTKGTHDFKIDEFNVALETPEGEEVMVEFVADKAGDFEFYCSKWDHRKIGQTGRLKVTE